MPDRYLNENKSATNKQWSSKVHHSFVWNFSYKKNVSISIIKKPMKCHEIRKQYRHKIIKPFSDALTLTFFDENVNESLENGDLWIRRLKKTFWKCRFASDPVWFISNVYNLFSCINHESAKHYNNFGMRKTEMRRKKQKHWKTDSCFSVNILRAHQNWDGLTPNWVSVQVKPHCCHVTWLISIYISAKLSAQLLTNLIVYWGDEHIYVFFVELAGSWNSFVSGEISNDNLDAQIIAFLMEMNE